MNPRIVRGPPFIDGALFNFANGKDFTTKDLMDQQLAFEISRGQKWREPTKYAEPSYASLLRQTRIQ